MNNTFNLSRFIMLFKKHGAEHAKIYLLSIVVLAGMIFLVLASASFSSHRTLPQAAQQAVFTLMLWLSGSVFTSLSFADLGDKKKASGILTLPASHLEKYLVVWVYSFILFQLIFIAVFYFADWIVISISIPPAGFERNHLFSLLYGRNIFGRDGLSFDTFIIYAFFHAFTFWGSIFFEKLHFVKTAVVFIVLAVMLVFINSTLLSALISAETLKNVPFQGLSYLEDGRFFRIQPNGFISWLGKVIMCGGVASLWLSAYYRLKEKQV